MMVDWDSTADWFLEHGIRIVIILLVSLIAYIVVRKTAPSGIRRTLSRTMQDQPDVEIDKRRTTLSTLLVNTSSIVIVIVALFLVLNEIGINIATLLAGFGVVGIAVGFGAQSLIRDLIAGFVVQVENQFNVGDVVSIANTTGIVESVNLRRTTLRNLDGILYFVPNGEIKVAGNYTRAWSRAHLDIRVAYKENVDEVMSAIRRVWEELARDTTWGPQVISKTPWLLRVNDFDDSGVTIKAVGETQPLKQWDVMGELRRRIKNAFDESGIEIPWNYTKVYLENDVRMVPVGAVGSTSGPEGPMSDGAVKVKSTRRRRTKRELESPGNDGE
jgi:small conductance mechanosensitive channel